MLDMNAISFRIALFMWGKNAFSLYFPSFSRLRNPDNDSTPWCYIYRGTQIVWDFCSLPKCPQGTALQWASESQRPTITHLVCLKRCFFACVWADKNQECVQASGQSYRGTTSVSKSGYKCLPWDSPVLKRKLNNAWRSDALALGLGNHNFCR